MKKYRIRTRLLAGYLIVIVIMLIISAFAAARIASFRGELNELDRSVMKADREIKECGQMVQYGARNIEEMIIAKNGTQMKDARQDFESALASIESSMKDLSQTRVLSQAEENSYISALDEWSKMGKKIASMTQKGDREGAKNLIWSQYRPALDKLSNMENRLEQKVDEEQNNSMQSVQSGLIVLTIGLVIAVIVAIIAAIILAGIIVRSIVRPLEEVNKSIRSLAEGELHNEPHYEGADELGEISQSLRTALSTLQTYIGDISTAMKMMADGDFNIYATEKFKGDFEEIQTSIRSFSLDISQTLEQIGIASRNVAGGANQISDGAQALSQGATEQASSVEEISATVSEISSQVKETANSANEMNQQAGDVGGQIRQSNEKMQRMLAAMDDINQESGNISIIIKTIDDISFQTNLLALNAAIEAARAGTAGKGFAVVADEVRDLASKSADSAKEISDLIGETLKSVEEGMQIAKETAEALQDVVENVEKIIGGINEITNNVQAEADSIEQVSTGIEQISSVVQTNSATAQQSAATSEELSGQSQLLEDMLEKFKLRDRTGGSAD